MATVIAKSPRIKKPHRPSKARPDSTRPKVLDLFAGAGGLSEGFTRAGFDVVGHIEMEKNAASTLTTRMIYHALIKRGLYDVYERYMTGGITRDDLVKDYGLEHIEDSVLCEKIGEDSYREIIDKFKTLLNGDKVDIIVGGPPCQAYSYIGRARDVEKMHTDERNFLYKYYIEFLKAFRPKMFVFENVPGLVTAGKGKHLEDMRKLMKEAGYDTDLKILNAADFGVPQNRKRVILIGWSDESGLTDYPEFKKVDRNYVVKDFLKDLPPLSAGDGQKVIKKQNSSELLNDLGITKPGQKIILDHVSRPNTERDLEIYRLAVQLKQNGENLKYNNLPERLKTHKNEKGFLDRFKVVDEKAPGSHTVVAHIGKDGHFYIHPDIAQNRSLSVREAARLQTFPDDYIFEGSRGPQFKQIGNAVPPILAEVIAKTLKEYL